MHDEQEVNKLYEYRSESFAESLSYFPEMESYNTGTKDYLNLLETARSKVQIPLIGSLNGASIGGWTGYAESIVNAGADAPHIEAIGITLLSANNFTSSGVIVTALPPLLLNVSVIVCK